MVGAINTDLVAGFDARFPNTNQTKRELRGATPATNQPDCFQNYVDYHKCILAKGEEFKPCQQFWRAARVCA